MLNFYNPAPDANGDTYNLKYYDAARTINMNKLNDPDEWTVTPTQCKYNYDVKIVPRLFSTGPYHDPLPPGFSWDPATSVLTMGKCATGQDPGGDTTDDPDCSNPAGPTAKADIEIVMLMEWQTSTGSSSAAIIRDETVKFKVTFDEDACANG